MGRLNGKTVGILANDCIVPECLQYRCTPKILASELDKFLNSTKNIKKIISYYEKFSKNLRKQADYGAANAVLQLIENDKLNWWFRNRQC